jgi:hypothetical protein
MVVDGRRRDIPRRRKRYHVHRRGAAEAGIKIARRRADRIREIREKERGHYAEREDAGCVLGRARRFDWAIDILITPPATNGCKRTVASTGNAADRHFFLLSLSLSRSEAQAT